MNNVIRIAFGCATLVLSAGANAHAFLDHARPAVGSTVHGSPAQVQLWFTTPLEPAFSRVKVVDKDGKEVDRKDQQVDQSDRSVLKVSLPPLPPGSYRVIWRVLSVDTHVTDGDFEFDIAP